jgi:hypothetical protein
LGEEVSREKETARHFGITERTVRAYLSNIYTKLNVDSRSSAVAVALGQGNNIKRVVYFAFVRYHVYCKIKVSHLGGIFTSEK